MNLSLVKSPVTWVMIGMFIVGGLEAVNIIPAGVAASLLALLGGTGVVAHSSQITSGRIS